MSIQIPGESEEGAIVVVSHRGEYPTWTVMMNKVLMGRGRRGHVSGEGRVMRKEPEEGKQSVLSCRHREHCGRKRIILKVWLIQQRKCSELCFFILITFNFNYSIIIKWFEAGVSWKFMAITQEGRK